MQSSMKAFCASPVVCASLGLGEAQECVSSSIHFYCFLLSCSHEFLTYIHETRAPLKKRALFWSAAQRAYRRKYTHHLFTVLLFSYYPRSAWGCYEYIMSHLDTRSCCYRNTTLFNLVSSSKQCIQPRRHHVETYKVILFFFIRKQCT